MAAQTMMQTAAFLAGRPLVHAAQPARVRSSVVVRAAATNDERAKWYPGAKAPSYLDGSLPGDYGFDPLRLGANEKALPWYVEAERTNGRWAMAAVAGILATDLLGKGNWWELGAKADLPIPLNTLIAIEVVVMGLVEAKRYQGWKKTGKNGFLNSFPFDPAGLYSEEMQIKEVKNGRLAMLAFLGFCSQAAVRGLGPIDSLKLHLSNTGYENIYTSKVGQEFTLAVLALSIWPIVIEAKRALSNKDDDDEFRPLPF